MDIPAVIEKITIKKVDHVNLILVCGYNRHGKTTFSNDLLKRDLSKWTKIDYYGKTGSIFNFFDDQSKTGSLIMISAFADLVKQEVHQMLGIDPDFLDRYSFSRNGRKIEIKETPFVKIPSLYQYVKNGLNKHFSNMDENNTLRDCYIHIGQKRKIDHGKNYWAKTLIKRRLKYFPETDSTNVLIISDLRFKEELAYISQNFTNVITIRIIDPKKSIPTDVETEKQLDNLKTDYLFVPKMSFVDEEKTTRELNKIFSSD